MANVTGLILQQILDQRTLGMKKLIFLFCILTFSSLAWSKIIVVSDLDETIKHTTCEVPSTSQTLRRAIFSSKVYSAMPELHRKMTRYADRLFILTGSPGIAKPFIRRLIRKNNIPVDWLYTNNVIPFRSTYRHKMRRMNILLRSYPDHKFILIGDNTNKDATIYQKIAKKYPGRVLAIYIHRVKPMPNLIKKADLTNYYYSAYEIAYTEYVAGRMQLQDVEAVHNKLFTDEKKLAELFPHRVYCPQKTTYFDHMTDEGLRQFTELMREKIITYCKNKAN